VPTLTDEEIGNYVKYMAYRDSHEIQPIVESDFSFSNQASEQMIKELYKMSQKIDREKMSEDDILWQTLNICVKTYDFIRNHPAYEKARRELISTLKEYNISYEIAERVEAKIINFISRKENLEAIKKSLAE
jgi:hypothetical protein